MKSDLEIAHAVKLLPMEEVAAKAGIHEDEYVC
jgi:formyltetrahydrofolate synthetase